MTIKAGMCVILPDGRVGRVREKDGNEWRVRVKRFTSDSHQFLYFRPKDLEPTDCPQGWMSVTGYNNYVKKTLKKMRQRLSRK